MLQEEIAANLNEQSNRTLFTLTVVTVLALPINIIAGFFGMNVGGIGGDVHLDCRQMGVSQAPGLLRLKCNQPVGAAVVFRPAAG